MESALDVLSRAATMVQDNANESRLTSKELPTAAWRRERRLRTGEYHHPNHYPSTGLPATNVRALSPSSSPPPNAHAQHSSASSSTLGGASAHQISMMMTAATSIRPLCESKNHSLSPPPHSNFVSQIHFDQISHTQCLQKINSIQSDDAPLDMSFGNLKQRNSPPPPYREPLPGSHYASSLARPSVITQAPPKRDIKDSILVTNRENDSRSCESIDEHFRRSLGNDYFSLFTKSSSNSHATSTLSPQPRNPQPPTAHARSSSPLLSLSSGASILPQHSEITSLPAYPVNFPSTNCQHAHQNQATAASRTKNILLSPALIASQTKMKTISISPPLPLVVRSNVMQTQLQNLVSPKCSSSKTKTPLTSPQPPVHSANVKPSNTMQASILSASQSRTASPIQLQQQSSSATTSLSHVSSLDSSPSSSPCHTPPVHNVLFTNPSSNIPTIMRIKVEPGLQNVKSKNPTPPASPTSATNFNISNSNSTTSSQTSSPSSPKTSLWKSTNPGSASADILASVDDHFAKALGDTWKKLQENKEMRK